MLSCADARCPQETDEVRLIPTESIADMSSKGVTIWKNILSVFGGIDTNFAGEHKRLEVGKWLENGLPTNLN